MAYTIEPQREHLLVKLDGNIVGEHQTQNLWPELDALWATDELPVVADLSTVLTMNSMGLAILLKINERSRQRGLPFAVAAPNDTVKRLLQITKLDTVLTVRPTLVEAVATTQLA